MIAEDRESVLLSTDAPVLIECQVDARHTRVVGALAEERNRLTASPRLYGTSQAFVPDAKGTLVFGKVLVLRVQSTLRIPRTVGHKRGSAPGRPPRPIRGWTSSRASSVESLSQTAYDLGFLALSVLLIVGGWLVARLGERNIANTSEL